jgi:hypothetical protein
MTTETLASDMLIIFQNKAIDLSNSLEEVNQNMRELENRQHTLEGKLSEVEYVIRYLEQNIAEANK